MREFAMQHQGVYQLYTLTSTMKASGVSIELKCRMVEMGHEEVTGQAGGAAGVLPCAWFSSSRVAMDLKLFMTFQVQKK